MIDLIDKVWMPFRIEDVFDILPGKRLTKADMSFGKRPFIGATDSNNGITEWVNNTNNSLDKDVIGVNYNGSVGEAFYHPYECIFSDDVKRLHIKPKYLDSLCEDKRFVMLFLKTVLLKQKIKYAYGYKFNESRMSKQAILLPVTSDKHPDWQFMEDYMREQEMLLLKPAIESISNRLNISKIGGGKANGWKEFDIVDVFTEIQRGKRLKKANHTNGITPYVSSTFYNNGVDGFIGNDEGTRIFKDCLTIANSGSVGSTFYHPYSLIASDHVTELKRKELDRYAYLFLATLTSRLSEKYSFNREINDSRIKREKILLPINQNGDIDFEYMSSFMRQQENEMLQKALQYFEKRLTA